MQQQLYHKNLNDANLGQKDILSIPLPSFEDWLDNQDITEDDIDDMYQTYHKEVPGGKIPPVTHIFSRNHQPSRYTDSLKQINRQHEYGIYPKLEYAVKMSMFFLLTKNERHGYSREAVAISRLNYVDAVTSYLKTVVEVLLEVQQ